MRLWSLHPRFLDTKGIVALWREALLAQKVLMNQTKGYKNHPQLIRFKALSNPLGGIATYLWTVQKEARRRNYKFDGTKIKKKAARLRLTVTHGQLSYEFRHLMRKLKKRDRLAYLRLRKNKSIEPHPLFRTVAGKVETWERSAG